MALEDIETKIAVPLEVVNIKDLGLRIKDLIELEVIERVVVGLPLGMNGQETEQTREVKKFIKDLRSKTNIEIITADERLTTAQAKRSGKDDAVAAMYILQLYIDRNYG